MNQGICLEIKSMAILAALPVSKFFKADVAQETNRLFQEISITSNILHLFLLAFSNGFMLLLVLKVYGGFLVI